MRVVSLSINGMSVQSKIEEVWEGVRKKLDGLGMQKTHIKACGVMDYMEGNECEMWKGMEGGVVWCGVDEKSRGRVCSSVLKEMEGYRGTWMGGIKNSMSSGENSNC